MKIQQFTIQGPGGDGATASSTASVSTRRLGDDRAQPHHAHPRQPVQRLPERRRACRSAASSGSSTGSATVKNNNIDDYQKNGVTVGNDGSSADIENNDIQGAGPTATIAQNGVQVSSGATGQVKNNTISGNVYSPQTATATGILLYADSPRGCGSGRCREQRLNANDTGVYAYQAASSSDVENNKVVNSTDDGVTVDTSDGLLVQNNQVQTNDQGVGVYATMSATIMGNNADDNRSNGFYAGSDTSGNTFQSNNADDSGLFDCRDDSHGTGTAGTGNFWLKDKGDTSMPPGICH